MDSIREAFTEASHCGPIINTPLTQIAQLRKMSTEVLDGMHQRLDFIVFSKSKSQNESESGSGSHFGPIIDTSLRLGRNPTNAIKLTDVSDGMHRRLVFNVFCEGESQKWSNCCRIVTVP